MPGIVRLIGSLAIALLLVVQPAAGAAWAAERGNGPAGNLQRQRVAPVSLERGFGQLPLYFVENQGQLDPQVAYYIQGSDKAIYFSPQGVTFALSGPVERSVGKNGGAPPVRSPDRDRIPPARDEALPQQRWVVKLDFLGANPDVRPVGLERTEAVISYFRGSPDQWHTGLPTYAKIVYRELWPGIDLVYYGGANSGAVNRLKYEFLVRPGADPAQIRLAYRGASNVWVDEAGQLQVSTPLGGLSDETPLAYQEGEGGQRLAVDVAYAALEQQDGAFSYGFRLGPYDPGKPLVLDPAMLLYCGYIGGAETDLGYGIAVDATGNTYVTGYTTSSEATFPAAVGPDVSLNGVYPYADAFVAKVNAAGTALLYCGYIGGSDLEIGHSITVDGAGNAYVTGSTWSSEATFPATRGPDLSFNGGIDVFVAKVNAEGTTLIYCGYIGGDSADSGGGIAVDGAGNAYVTGETYSSEATFPVTVGPDLSYNGGGDGDYDAFVAKIDAAGKALLYCGYIGGSDGEYGHGIAVDGSGNAYVTGDTSSSEATFPATVGPDLSFNGGIDAFVAKVNAEGTALGYCGYIGGDGGDLGYGVAVDGSGNAYVTGQTSSSEATFPVTVGPDPSFNGIGDAFVAKVDAAGTALDYCGYIGGSLVDVGHGIAVDGAGNAYVTGETTSREATFPVTIGPDLSYNGGDDDAFVAKVSSEGAALLYCGYIGGSEWDIGYGIAVDGSGNAYVTGRTDSGEATFPVTFGPDLRYNGGEYDALVAKVSVTCLEAFGLTCGGADTRRNDGQGSANLVTLYSCSNWLETGPEVAYLFAPDTTASVTVTLSGLSADLEIFVLGGQPGCNPAHCIAYGDDAVTFGAVAGESYTLFVDGYDGSVSEYTINVECVEWTRLALPLLLQGWTHY